MKPIVFDLETSISTGPHGPDFRDPTNDFYTIIYGDVPARVVCEHNSQGFGRMLPNGMVELLATKDVIVGHNLGFDLSYIFHLKEFKDFISRGGVIWDTQVAEYILTAQQHQYSSLADLQEKYLGSVKKVEKISGLFKKGIGADKIVQSGTKRRRLWNQYEEYCRLDGATTLEIFKQQYIRAKQENMLQIVQLYQDYLLSLINMTTSGIQLDMGACEQTLTDFNLKHIEYLEQAQELIKPLWNNPRLPKFNINSPDHKSAILFGGEIKNILRTNVGKYKNGNEKYSNVEHKIWVDGFQLSPIAFSRNTKKQGVYATDNAVMQCIEANSKNERVKKYCGLQKEAMMYKKAAKTYVEAFINLSVNGTLYPNFNNVATTTGRLSSSKPNMQNVSKRNKFGKVLHRLFVAPPGWKCIQIDFSQLEVWVMAWLSGDPLLQKHLLEGIDMHCVRLGYYNEDKTYDEIYKLCKVLQDPHWNGERSKAKTVSYQMAYGAMPPKVAESTGLPLETVELIFAKEAETYPNTVKLGDNVMKSIQRTATFSLGKNIPGSQKKGASGHKFYKNIELLPIFDKDGNIRYTKDEFRKVGYWTSPTGKKYHFLQNGRMFKGSVSKGFSFTQPKNYPMQGTAADIQGATTAELLRLLIKHPDKIKMINEVHDSKWFYVKEEFVSQIIPMIRDKIENISAIFSRRFGRDVPFRFPVDVEIGDNFADMERYDETIYQKQA
jgi:DNA polymerase I-like protein with 3'-5' exonuclease and polymerase domains